MQVYAGHYLSKACKVHNDKLKCENVKTSLCNRGRDHICLMGISPTEFQESFYNGPIEMSLHYSFKLRLHSNPWTSVQVNGNKRNWLTFIVNMTKEMSQHLTTLGRVYSDHVYPGSDFDETITVDPAQEQGHYIMLFQVTFSDETPQQVSYIVESGAKLLEYQA